MGLLFHLGLPPSPEPSSIETDENDLFVVLPWMSFCILEGILGDGRTRAQSWGSSGAEGGGHRTVGFSSCPAPVVGFSPGQGQDRAQWSCLCLSGWARSLYPAGRVSGRLRRVLAALGCLRAWLWLKIALRRKPVLSETETGPQRLQLLSPLPLPPQSQFSSKM